MNRILNKIFEDEKFTEAHTPHSKNPKKSIRRNEKFRQRNVDENKDSTIQKNDEVIIFFN